MAEAAVTKVKTEFTPWAIWRRDRTDSCKLFFDLYTHAWHTQTSLPPTTDKQM